MKRRRLVVIGLGSNIGDRLGAIRRTIARLEQVPELTVKARSRIYESRPAGGPPQGDYLNAAVLVDTALEPRELLLEALAIERELGRVRHEAVRWGPRTMDLDLLWIEGESVREPGLVVPHPRLRERPFAVRPLLDVVPDAVDPDTRERIDTWPASRVPISLFDGET